MSETASYPRLAQFRDVPAFRGRLAELGLSLPVDERVLSAAEGSPLAEPIAVGEYTVGNRWCIHPMEGWDANPDGSPSSYTLRRWRNFGLSGAKLIWGGEAAAVQPGGRANPNQTLATDSNRPGLRALFQELASAHRARYGTTDDLFIGLQLTHSGRFCKPTDQHRMAPRIAYHHPLLDEKFHIDPNDNAVVLTDDEIEQLIDDYLKAAGIAQDTGFHFVDIKACHGYLLHEFLSARRRPGRFGGDLAGRSRVMLTIIDRIRNEHPSLAIGVRLSVFDGVPYVTSRETGRPMDYTRHLPYEFGFGVNPSDPTQIDLTEPVALMRTLVEHGGCAINITCGSPYYTPHMQRPAIFPPIDGYQPPEDPLVGVWRQIDAVRQCKEALPNVPVVGTGYSYLQEYLPHVAQAAVRLGWTDFVGLGRMVLSYPDLPADVLAGKIPERKRICRTFSDCTTAPRNGLISGCYPLDPYYKRLPERERLIEIKQQWAK